MKVKRSIALLLATLLCGILLAGCNNDPGSGITSDGTVASDAGSGSVPSESSSVGDSSAASGAGTDAAATVYPDTWSWDLAEDASIEERIEEELAHFKYVRNRPHAYDSDWLFNYVKTTQTFYESYLADMIDAEGNLIQFEGFSDTTVGLYEGVVALREQKVQIVEDPEEALLYIWGDDMPQVQEIDESIFIPFRYDLSGFRPFMVPYILDNQENVKGNIVVVAGGAYISRENYVEGYPIAEAFNEMGYNAFVLQRRVIPAQTTDAHLDLQRSIRYLKHHAEAMGIGGIENIAAVGFSGGGMTILGQNKECYGDITPDTICPAYIPDAIDEINSDYKAMMIIYGGFGEYTTENANIPSTFIVASQNDEYGAGLGSTMLYASLEKLVPTELHIYPGAPHGFGTGTGVPYTDMPGFVGADQWITQADLFLQVEFGHLSRSY